MTPTDLKINAQIDALETGLAQLDGRLPQVPVHGILLCRLMMLLGREMGAMLDHHIRPMGLAEAEFRVLTALFSQPEGVGYPSDLCARAAQSPANMSRISDELVRRELITRVHSDQDRRRMVLGITPKGEQLVRSLLPTLFAPMRELFSDFSEAEQQHLIGQLKRLAGRLEQSARPNVAEPA